MKYLYAFAVRGGFLLSLLLFSFFANAQVIDSQRLNKVTSQKIESPYGQNSEKDQNYTPTLKSTHTDWTVNENGTDGIDAFPSPYCVVSGLSSVEPITRVIVADIDNASPNQSSAPRHEDFTSVIGHMTQGSSYELKVEGNTSGNFTTSVHVYVDWNNDGYFTDAGEYSFGGTLVNSTGSDGKQAIGTIVVPSDATVGNKRMRIIKRFQNVVPNPNDGCTGGSSFGQAEDYTLFIGPLPNCSGTPSGGSAKVTPTTGPAGSIYTVSASGYTLANGLTFQWQSNTNSGGWTNVGSSTPNYANYTATAPAEWGSIVEWRLIVTCTFSNISNNSTVATFKTGYCTPSSTTNTRYIKSVNFVGTLVPDTNYPNTTYSSNGYGDYTTSYPNNIPKQIPGGGINLNFKTDGDHAFIKSWIDWNKNGIFDSNEIIYDTGSILTPSTTFGFVVPSGAAPGIYTLRIRTSYDAINFGPCGNLYDGETEDYSFEVIADCPAKITAVNINPGDGVRCGTGSVKLTATGTTGTTNYHWYTSEFGGSPIYSHPSGIYNTPDINSTTTLYVTAFNGSCESVKRTPVVARIDPIPTIDFNQTESDICSDVASMTISSTGDKEEITLIHEKFDSGLGVFKNVIEGNTNNNANWINRNSPYIPTNPPYNVLSPAISSGYDGGKYAVAITDVQQTSDITRRLELINSVNVSELTNIKLDFDLYYRPMIEENTNYSYFRIQASLNGGANWANLQTITTAQGNPGKWSKQSLTLPSNYNTNTLKVRFVIFSYGASSGWVGDIAAVDNIRLYGDKPLDTTFTWNAPGMDVFNADCTTPYSGASTEVCIKPNDSQIENNAVWDITATATLSNGCDAVGHLQITNNNKVWNPSTSATDWTSNAWKPSSSAPTADHCVIVKKELVLPTGQSGLAKNLLVKSGAKLTIQNDASLTVTDFVHNEAAVEDFLIKSGGSLVQVNDGALNSGEITAERDFIFSSERKQYNFVISPLVDWPIKSMYTTPFVIKYVEGQNWFVNAGVGPYVPAKGYAIKEAAGGNSTISGIFKGVPANGLMSYPLQYGTATTQTGDQENGYNLVGNPYPSALDLTKLYADNSAKIEATFLFWDNRDNPNTQQQGSDYNGSNYATFNATADSNGTGTAAPRFIGQPGAKIPNQFAATGTAFLTRAISSANGEPLNFKNAHRSASTTATEFFGKNDDGSKNTSRYWLTLTTPSGIEYMTAVVYHWEGNNAFSVDDSEAPGTSDEIYTLADNDQVIIQGREPFIDTDEVPLGVRLFDMGKYVISIYDKEGVFANGQNIYLRDKVEKVIYNLSQADYKFISEPGEFNTRFELIYKPYSLTDDASNSYSNKISIELKDKNIVATSTEHKITKIVLYDLNNRPMYLNSEVNALKISIPTKLYANQIVVVSLETETGEVMNKKLILK